MGLNRHSLNILLNLKQIINKSIAFDNIATIGRQGIHENKSYLNKFFKKNKLDFNIGNSEYCEDFFKQLGNKHLDSIDYSDFEGCTIIQDMNEPISLNYHNKYDLVLDGGSLEHIFDFKTSISNCMNLVKKGGYFIGVFPTNNYPNHGFYQFSPELFFRCFSLENGFEEGKMFIYFEKKSLNLYEIIDPKKLKRRNQFKSNNYTMCFFISKKIEHKSLFENSPIQSDYDSRWKGENLTLRRNFKGKVLNSLKQILPKGFKINLLNFYEYFLLFFTGFGILDKDGIKKKY